VSRLDQLGAARRGQLDDQVAVDVHREDLPVDAQAVRAPVGAALDTRLAVEAMEDRVKGHAA
jgi:hypothetical protein